MSTFGVDSYHISVGTGDAAVHLLVQTNTNPKTIINAVLIDGGKKDNKVVPNIEWTIAEIEGMYTLPVGSGGKLKFDSIVVTHWDADHYQGIMQLIQNDITTQLTASPPATPATLCISFMKYKNNKRTQPQTTFYAPYWAERINKKNKVTANGHPREVYSDAAFLGFNYTAPKKTVKYDKICILQYNNVLGINFLTRKGVPKTKAINSPLDLVKLNPPAVIGHPGIYCVASDRAVLGGKPGAVEVINKGITPTNKASIAAMVIWSDGTLSHYFAGDADYVVEKKIALWTQGGKTARKVTTMKISHHGANSSTPTMMLDLFIPKNIVISCGDSYGHPSWELMLYLDAWLLSKGLGIAASKPVYTTEYPYYLARNKDGFLAMSSNPSAFLEPKAPDKNFLKALKTLYTLISKKAKLPLENVYEGFTAASKSWSTDPEERQEQAVVWILEAVEERWGNNLSTIPAGAHTASSAAFVESNNTAVHSTKKYIRYILVESRKGIADGKIFIRYAERRKVKTIVRKAVTKALDPSITSTTINGKRPAIKDIRRKGTRSSKRLMVNNAGGFIQGDDENEAGGEISDEDEDEVELESDIRDGGTPGLELELEIGEGVIRDNDNEFSYYCSELASQVSGVNVQVLDAGSDLDDFVTLLHYGVITLGTKLTANNSSDFVDTDEWLWWFQNCLGATTFTAIAKDSAMDAFSFTMTSPDGGAQTMSFSTSSVAFAFDLTTPWVGSVPGFLKDDLILIFGLDLDPQSPVVTMCLPDVFTYVGLTDLAQSTVIIALGSVQVELDTKKSKGCRNAVWFDPASRYKTVQRLQFTLQDQEITTFLQFLGLPSSFQITNAKVIARKTSHWVMIPDGIGAPTDGEVILTAECTIATGSGTPATFGAAIEFLETSVNLELTVITPPTLDDILGWLEQILRLPTGSLNFSGWLTKSGATSSSINFRRLSMTIPKDSSSTNSGTVISEFSIDLEVDFKFGGSDIPAIFLVTYSWAAGETIGDLKASLWCAPPDYAIVPYARLMPDWEDYLEFAPLAPNQSEFLDLSTMFPSGSLLNIPKDIPHDICQASLEINDDGIIFYGAIFCDPPQAGQTLPTVTLGKIGLGAQYTFKKGNQESAFTLEFDMQASMNPAPTSAYKQSALLTGSVKYDTGSWTLSASVHDLFAATLYSFFDKESQDGVIGFLESIEIKYLSLEYSYQKEGLGSEFTFIGDILLGELELTLNFHHDTNGWTFKARLSDDNTSTTTIGDIVESLTGSPADLPSFVKNINVAPKPTDSVTIDCANVKNTSDPSKSYFFFSASVDIHPLRFTFVQYQGPSPWKGSPKRVMKVTVESLPSFDVPIVGNLTQPFDEMYYMWVQDGSEQNLDSPGLTKQEIEDINLQLDPADQLMPKNTKANPGQTDVLIAAGSHFVVVLKGEKGDLEVVMDYVFGQPMPKTPAAANLQLTTAEEEEQGDGTSPPSDSSSMTTFKKTIGPLSISNIGFQLKGSTLSILFDASVVLGPIGFSLQGFGLSLDFSDETSSLQNLPKLNPMLSGLAIEFDRPPLVVSGLFEKTVIDKSTFYVGGVIVSFDPYLFEAAGFYGNTGDTTSAFIFGMLQGPLVELEFALISGITGGFGYNVHLRLPGAVDVPTFPFLNMPTPTGSPMDTLTGLTTGPNPWFSPLPGSFWVAAGLKVTAFETLSIDAVVVVEWNPYVTLGIFGMAVADVPAGVPQEETFAHVELGIAATVDFNAGVMKFEAQLTPNSYILSPSCHLTGGFALYYWFGGAALAGDWVFTIGGYHQVYRPPPQYPTPPRLAISWSLDSSLSITGQAYFAITPKVAMGGGALHASLSLGALEAFFDAYADFLINFKPFHFIGDVGVSVGVRFTLDLWIVTLHISVEIGAQLEIQGPALSGIVHVDFWVFGFDIHFGPGASAVNPVDLPTFYNLLSQSDTQGVPTAASSALTLKKAPQPEVEYCAEDTPNLGADAPPNDHVLSCETGLLTPAGSKQSTPPGSPWSVRSGTFSFRISSRFAICNAAVQGAKPVPGPTPIYAKPMQLVEALQSDLEVTFTFSPHAASKVDSARADEPAWKVAPALKSVPNALWGIYNSSEDPSNPNSDPNTILNTGDATTSLMMGIIITAPNTTLTDAISPFNAVAGMVGEVFPAGKAPLFPVLQQASGDWLPGESQKGPAQWDAVSGKWGNPVMGTAVQQQVVDTWVGAFGWAVMSGVVPPILLKDFDDIYLAAPMLSV